MEKLKNLTLLAVSMAVSLAMLEGLVRLASGSIPIAVIADAPEMAARTELLDRHGLSVETPVMVLESSVPGPDIVLPRDVTHVPLDPEDARQGAIATAYRTDGFCNDRPPQEIPATLVGVGDSFTYCTSVAVEDSWVHRLSGLLGMATANLGMPGNGLAQYYDALRQKAPRTTRLGVVGLYEGNDLRDALRFQAARHAGQEGTTSTGVLERVSRFVRSGFLGHSYVLVFVWGNIRTLEDRLANPEFSYDVGVDGRRMTLNVHDTDPDEVRNARSVEAGEITKERVVELWNEPIGWIVDLARERGFATLFVYIPSAYTAYGESVRFHNGETGAAVRKMSEVQRAAFAAICESRGLDCLDTVAAFEAAGGKRLTHFPSNVHLTPYGHRVVADAVAQYISTSPRLSQLLPRS